uniref:Suppressor of forked domain-containing protein n=1 Tax=Ascaris lumbricoides TaxID=6252 RepID=A0A9J2Q9J5_ASCLU
MPILDEIGESAEATTERESSSKEGDSMGMATPKPTTVVLEDEDVGFEENILRNPFSLRCWLRYIEHKKKCKAPLKQINMVYERALKELPGSYKLWYNYLRFRRKQVADKCPTDAAYQRLNNVYERALVFMHKMPRIWMDYCELMTQQRLITDTRRVFDRALRALPVTQHERIWPLYIKFVTSHAIPETTIRVYRRYLKLMPKYREDFVEYLREIDRLDDAAQQLATLVNDDKLVSEHGKTTHQLWTELCELISKNPNKVHSLNVDSIIRQGIQRFVYVPFFVLFSDFYVNCSSVYVKCIELSASIDKNSLALSFLFMYFRYSDQVGVLWCALAEYYIRAAHFEKMYFRYSDQVGVLWCALAEYYIRAAHFEKMYFRYSDQVGVLWCALAEYYIRAAHFEKARDVYEEAIVSVKTVRDFTQIFDAYAKFAERATASKMDEMDAEEAADEDQQLELELLFARFEHLMDRRPLLLNSVLLRQNPHNAHEWLNRVQLYEGNKIKQVETYEEAVRTVQPKFQTGKLSSIWISFAKFYEREKQLNDARAIFEKGLEPAYCKVDDLATVWCEYAEFELRHRFVLIFFFLLVLFDFCL